ncbi:hypothetical protein [Dictyobacter kobayashii]|uniref:Uncharacterized protein n=1 Tax=Dictyobacter kobayashii TaxID=2014872 RepID=A0A402AJ29_9CHLR|nr:hypothetical protein [Dictyobacter kobayashii]GCE19122.1 hypothetical protein KDK_29220 [Dictyobacter kobayashii]
MLHSLSYQATQPIVDADAVTIFTLPRCNHLNSREQVRSFELLRLAFFALKLRKFEQRYAAGGELMTDQEFAFRRSLLLHVIFQQLVSLTRLGAREQALQLIETCRK